MNAYWFAARPSVEHRHPFLVFDCQDRLHLPLTMFGKEASVRVSPKTVQMFSVNHLVLMVAITFAEVSSAEVPFERGLAITSASSDLR